VNAIEKYLAKHKRIKNVRQVTVENKCIRIYLNDDSSLIFGPYANMRRAAKNLRELNERIEV
jgi:hypothetical protein